MTPSRSHAPGKPKTGQASATPPSQPSVVLIDEGHGWPAELLAQLREEGYSVTRLFSCELVPVLVRSRGVAAVLADLHRLRPEELAALRQCRQSDPGTAIVLVSQTSDRRIAAQALDWGATALLVWPASRDALRSALGSAVARDGM